MCFSATASFGAAALLIPAGGYCLKRSMQVDKRNWAFAMMPLLFGVQQLFEGGVWMSLQLGNPGMAHNAGLGFLFFSHWFWLGWVGYSSYLTERIARRKQLFQFFCMSGLLFGAVMYLPVLFIPEWLTISVLQHAIHYDLHLVLYEYIPEKGVTILYAAIILIPLLLSSHYYHRILGVLIFISGVVTWLFFDWAFISVWCYCAAIISLYIFLMIAHSVQTQQRHDIAI